MKQKQQIPTIFNNYLYFYTNSIEKSATHATKRKKILHWLTRTLAQCAVHMHMHRHTAVLGQQHQQQQKKQ